MSKFHYLKNVVTVRLNPDLCIGCGMCETVCPHAVIRMEDRVAVIVDRDGCMECGACARNCPAGAVSVDAGVGCAAAVINSALGRTSGDSCCLIEPRDGSPSECAPSKKSGCC